jgi:Domain of unknown function (DUF4838)
MKRRSFLLSLTGSLISAGIAKGTILKDDPFFSRRCLTIWVEDILKWNWPEKAHQAGINTIATHHDPEEIVAFIHSEKGRVFMEQCRELGIGLEHSLHAYSSLLPRDLFKKNQELFRMNPEGERTPDANFCVSNEKSLSIVAENAVKYAKLLPSTTGRYLYISDDAKQMCSCPKCAELSPSEQTLLVQNKIIRALREHIDPKALVSHPAYVWTLNAPTRVRPEPGIFLEFAPITRTYKKSIVQRDAKNGEHGRLLDALYRNIEVFGNDNAQVFEYWFDSYRASGWKTREENWVRAPWNPEVLHKDLAFYKEIGFKSITSVTCWTNQDYVDRFGEPPLNQYGKELLSW